MKLTHAPVNNYCRLSTAFGNILRKLTDRELRYINVNRVKKRNIPAALG